MLAIDVIRYLASKDASELLLVPGEPPRLRRQSGDEALDLPRLDAVAVEEVLGSLLRGPEWAELLRTGAIEVDKRHVRAADRVLRIRASREGVSLASVAAQ